MPESRFTQDEQTKLGLIFGSAELFVKFRGSIIDKVMEAIARMMGAKDLPDLTTRLQAMGTIVEQGGATVKPTVLLGVLETLLEERGPNSLRANLGRAAAAERKEFQARSGDERRARIRAIFPVAWKTLGWGELTEAQVSEALIETADKAHVSEDAHSDEELTGKLVPFLRDQATKTGTAVLDRLGYKTSPPAQNSQIAVIVRRIILRGEKIEEAVDQAVKAGQLKPNPRREK